MDTGRIKQFAIESRKILKEGVMQRIKALGFDEQGRTPDVPEKVQGGTRYQGRMIENERFYDSWIALNEHIQKVGVKAVYEEAAYTWFNRLIAIRIMQKNHFIEPVLSYDNPEIRVPHIVSEARRGSIMCSLTDDEQNRLRTLLMDDTKTQEQFALLIIAYCRENAVISKCFGGIAPYLELLLPDDILSQNRFIDLLNNTNEYITEDQFRSAELIGWLYQFYISEKKDEVFASFKKGRKAEAEDIPAATQIFTPNWIVKYMVQNTVGRIYLDNNPYCPLKKDWKYLVEPTEKTPKEAILNIDNLEDLTLADLACGSGHILVEGFDLLYSLYIDEGYSRYDAVKNIFTKNLTGIDLDTRAKQLATFALLLKAAQIDPKFLDGEIMPRVYDMPNVDRYTWRDLNGHMTCALNIEMRDENIYKELDEAFDLLSQAQNLGSIMKFEISDATREFIIKCVEEQNKQHKFEDSFKDLFHGFNIILALTEKYAALAMNPPYMGSGNMNPALSDYVKVNYEKGKTDLCTSFMIMQSERVINRGFYANIIPPSWMFVSAFEGLRRLIIDNQSIRSLLHLSRGVFGADFGSISTVIQNCENTQAPGIYFRLIDRTFQEFDQKHLKLLFEKTLVNHDFRFYFADYTKDIDDIVYNEKGAQIYYSGVDQKIFNRIPGSPIGYWVSEKMSDIFVKYGALSACANPCVGLQTADNAKFLRLWHEVENNKIYYGEEEDTISSRLLKKWFPTTKGGTFRRWYGNMYYVVNWENDGEELKSFKGAVIRNKQLYFKQNGSTWSTVASGKASFRYFDRKWLFETKGSVCLPFNEDMNYLIMAYLNSPLVNAFLKVLSPTLDFHEGPIGRLPFICNIDNNVKSIIDNIVKTNISIVKDDWNSHETSWDFEINPLLELNEIGIEEEGEIADLDTKSDSLEIQFKQYKVIWEQSFHQLHKNEEELNRQFIEIYGLEDELTPDVPLDEITILQQGEISIVDNQILWHPDVIMKQFISYAIGCMMGRYRLDKKGLCIAHPNPSAEEIAPYHYNEGIFEIDDDGIIPLMAKDSRFDDNCVNRLTDFVKLVFGEETLTDNMNYLEEALGKSVEQYLIKDFWKDHKKMYQNRPIYWLFSSKKGAFQVVAYMHRMNKYTVENIRNKYLLPHIEYLRQELVGLDSRITALTPQERKQYQKLQKDLDECMEYHDRLHYVADQQIDFDLDDGVVVNYAKFGDVLAKLK